VRRRDELVAASATYKANPHAGRARPTRLDYDSAYSYDRAMQQLRDAVAREEGKSELRRLFTTLDRNGDGRISITEWARGMADHGPTMAKYFGGTTYEHLMALFRHIDTNGSGYLSWEEVLRAAQAAQGHRLTSSAARSSASSVC